MRVTPRLERRLTVGLPLLVALLLPHRSLGAEDATPGDAPSAPEAPAPRPAPPASGGTPNVEPGPRDEADELEEDGERPVERPGSLEAPDRAKRTDEALPLPTDPRELERRQREKWRTSRPDSELPERAQVLALTIAGGVSLGSYEAGQLNLLAEALRVTPGAARLMIATGASAGSANALIAATSACSSRATDAESSLGYRVWVPVGLDQLYDPERVTARSLFVVDGLRSGVDTIANEWSAGLPSDCDFVVSMAATRAQGIDVELTEGLVVPRQSERFVFHVRGRANLLPLLENYVDPKRNFERPLLPFSGGTDLTGARDFAALGDAAIASAAFPVAFPEHVVPHCITPRGSQFRDSPTQPPRCETPTHRDAFVDGGVFDNNPLGISYQIARNGLTLEGARPAFRPVPSGGRGPRPEIVYGYVDPDLTRYPLYKDPHEKRKRDDPLLGALMNFSDQALNAARGQELSVLAERNPLSLRRLWLVQSGYPPISGLLGAFFGFFERDFRDFDFHLGQYDTYFELRQHTGSILGVEPFVDALDDQLKAPPAQVPARLRKLGCMLAHFEPETHGRLAPLCQGDELRNFRVLLQITLDRLWSNCRRVSIDPNQRSNHLQCAQARDGAAPPRVDRSFRVRGARYQAPDEDDFDYSMRLLADYGFHFRDLGLDPERSDRGRIEVRRRLVDMVEHLADAQPDLFDRLLVMTGGRSAVNAIAYEPPKDRAYVMFGSYLGVGSLHRVADLSWLYFNPDLRASNLRALFTDRTTDFSGTLAAGFEFALLPFSNNMYQTSVGLRAGYQFTGNDSAGFSRCEEANVYDSRNCSTLVTQLPLNFTLLERLRFNFTALFYPLSEDFGHTAFGYEWGLGLLMF